MNKSRHTPIHPHNTIVFKLYARHARCQQDVGQRLKRNTTGYVFRYNSTIKHLQKRGGGKPFLKLLCGLRLFRFSEQRGWVFHSCVIRRCVTWAIRRRRFERTQCLHIQGSLIHRRMDWIQRQFSLETSETYYLMKKRHNPDKRNPQVCIDPPHKI